MGVKGTCSLAGCGAALHKHLVKTRGREWGSVPQTLGKNKRRGCAGRAFDEVFATSYAESPITKATPQQQRSFLLAAQQIRADRSDGSVRILGNRFWHAQLTPHMGKRLTVRFDPDAPRAGVQIETADGRFVCSAPCVAAVGFIDQEAAKAQAKAQSNLRKATRQKLAAERALDASEVASRLGYASGEFKIPKAKVIQAIFPQHTDEGIGEEISQKEQAAFEANLQAGLQIEAAEREAKGL